MSLPALSIRRPVFAWMLMAVLMLFGMISFHRLGISQLPDVDSPVVGVSLSLPGAAPEVMESQVLDPLEDAIMEIDGIKSVTSSAQQSSGSISVEFELNRDIDESMQEIQNKINQVRNVLPTGLFPPTIRKSNPEDTPILWLAITSTVPDPKPIDLMIFTRNYLFNVFSTVPGVGNIAQGGYVDPALRVWVDLNRLDHFNLTSSDLITSIQSEQIEVPAGRLEGDRTEYNVRTMGEAWTPEEFGHITIDQRANQGPNYIPTKLSDVALVEEGTADVRKISRFNGKYAVGLGILKQHGSNAVEVANLVRAKLKEIQPVIPPQFHVEVRSDNTRFIKQSVDQLIFTLMLSALLTSFVCYLFLGSVTSTINVLFAIPTSIVGAFTAFYFFNFTLNTFTLLGLSLAIGIVVDDAIMMLENIVRHRELGLAKRQAALVGAEEITFAALAATIAVVAIFMPVVFMKGVIGRYFLQYGITVSVAVLLSLLEALTLTPMRCSRYLTVDTHPKGLAGFVERVFHRAAGYYQRVLGVLLRNRWKALLATMCLFVTSLFISRLVPSEMMPPQDQSQMLLRFKLPVGTSLPVTDGKMHQVENYLLKQPEVDGVYSAVGGFGGDAVNQGQAFVTLVDRNKRKLSQAELIKKYRKEMNELINGKGAPMGGGRHGLADQAKEGANPHWGVPQGPDEAAKAAAAGASGAAGASAVADASQAAGASAVAAAGASAAAVASTAEGEGPGGEHHGRHHHGDEAAAGASGAHAPSWLNKPGTGPSASIPDPLAGLTAGGKKKDYMEIVVQDLSLRGFASTRGFPVEFTVQGPNWEKLTAVTAELMAALRKSGVVTDVNTDIQPGMPEVELIPDRQKLAEHAVSLNTVTSIINALVGGQILNGQVEYQKGDHRYEIEVRLQANQRDSLPELNRIKIRNNRGEVVGLDQLVSEQIRPSLMLISRLNRARAIMVYANPTPGHSQQQAMDFCVDMARKMLPPGYTLILRGSSQSFKESIQSLMFAMLFGLLVSYMVLAAQFDSFIHPVTVLMALPFSVSGAFIGLWIGHQSINIYSLIGFILLMGIVKKNSILLVDFTNQLRREGLDVNAALLKACPVRLRPIIMTSVATIAGAFPEALDLGPGAETTIPMSIAIIGGVAASTLLTLFVVPCVYSVLSRFEKPDPLALEEMRQRQAAAAAAPVAAPGSPA